MDSRAELPKLAGGIREVLDSNLMPGETIEVVIHGIMGSAIVGTDRRVFVFGKQLLNLKSATWDYRTVTGIELDIPAIGRRLVKIHAAGAGPQLSTMQVGGMPGDADRARAGVAALRRWVAAGPSQEEHSASSTASVAAQLRELANLRDEGIVTEDEFNARKMELLKRL